MKITDALLGEHGVFYAQFGHLEESVPECGSLEQVQGYTAMLTAALETHACMEDHLLFTALEAHPGLASGPLPVMRQEHEWIESRLARVTETDDLNEARDSLLDALRIAREHFAKEERVLFPAAMQILGDERLEELGQQWAEKRQVEVTAEVLGCGGG
ncbi:MAG: hemerythrin domain-containing protein [Gemmatimonadetes bacterium]|jgi:hemerythrin-like domain-containing protein|nr:hemerythrin domain-containing protein [Gemmatimonadota bacterium]